MAPLHLRLWLRSILPARAIRDASLAVGVALLLCSVPRGSAAEQTSLAPVSSVTVESGESWLSLRARFCPLETVQAANPKLGDRPLKIGDVVRSPFVLQASVQPEFERTNQQRIEAEKRAAEALARTQELEAKVASFNAQGLEEQLASARAETSTWRTTAIAVYAVAAVLTLLVIGALGYAFITYRSGAVARTRLADTDRRYAELRQSLQKLDTEVQRRALKLLAGHGARVISEGEFAEATRPMLDTVIQLRQKHTG
jgi:hypothetical protein